MNTNELLYQFAWLRDEIALYGPSQRLLVARRWLNVILQLYRTQQKIEAMKRKRPELHIEFLDFDRLITTQEAVHLDTASQVNREIAGALRTWREGRRAGRNADPKVARKAASTIATNRLQRALQIREASLHLLRAQGIMREVPGLPGRCATATLGDMELLYRTPFQRLPARSHTVNYARGLVRQRGGADTANLEYGLDIWHSNRKVFNFEWATDDRESKLVAFKPGTWEETLLG